MEIVCTQCKQRKPQPRARTSASQSWCADCMREYQRNYQAKRRALQIDKEYQRQYRQKNHTRQAFLQKRWRIENKGRNKQLQEAWHRKNPEYMNTYSAARRARMLQAIPLWADQEKISRFFALAKLLNEIHRPGDELLEVDHIVPLKHYLVCGLHTQDNLRIVPKAWNRAKSDTFYPHVGVKENAI